MSQQLKQQQQQHRRSPSLEPPPRLLSPIIESNSPPHAKPGLAAAAFPPPLPEVSSPPRLDRSDAFHIHLSLCSPALTSTLEHLYFVFIVVRVHNSLDPRIMCSSSAERAAYS